jgi:hypothetical protein
MRYSIQCVAPEVQGWSTDDLDEAVAFVGGSYYGSHFDIWDREKGEHVWASPDDAQEAMVRLKLRDPHERCEGMGV